TMQVGDRPRREQLLREIQGLVQAQGCECLVQWYAGMAEGGGSRLVHVVLEFMDLGSLADLLERLDTDSRVPLPSLRCAAAQVAIALEFLHSRSILHRDIKPQNILHNSAGEVKLTDFGISKAFARGSEQDATATFVGTATYMSPE
ncbi:MKK1c, partial [Symbiodinium microadriaticum]